MSVCLYVSQTLTIVDVFKIDFHGKTSAHFTMKTFFLFKKNPWKGYLQLLCVFWN